MVRNQESRTAMLCAFARAWHVKTAEQKLFSDTHALALMGEECYEDIRRQLCTDETDATHLAAFVNTYLAPIPLSRQRFTEQRLESFTASDGAQYVICGAGADTFSFRNRNPEISVFEVDHPDTQSYKLERIRSLGWAIPKTVHFVPVDFETETMTGGLLAAGFRPDKRNFFSILGVSYYLTLPVFVKTLEQIAKLSAPGSVLVFDFPLRGENYPSRVRKLEEIAAASGEVMQGGYTYNEVSRALYRLGFQIDTYLTPEKVQKTYFDGRTDGLSAFENVSLLSAIYTGGMAFE